MPWPEKRTVVNNQKFGKQAGGFCPYCGAARKIVWVHGHGQCQYCGTNIDECCRGEMVISDRQK